jgi:autotransporter translocation and assembly factor TamB
MTADRPPRTLPRWLRWLLIALVAAVILVVLFTTVFPWIERSLSTPTLGG